MCLGSLALTSAATRVHPTATPHASTDPADPTVEATHRPKALAALLSHRARLKLTVEVGRRAGPLPAAADPLLESRGR